MLNENLREQMPRGTVLYPLQLYTIQNEKERMSVPYHWHREIELLFIMEGTLILTVNKEKFVGRKGDIFWIDQESLHGMYTENDQTVYHALVFPMEFLNFEQFDFVQSYCLKPLCQKTSRFPTKIPSGAPHYKQVWAELMEIVRLNMEKSRGYQIGTKASLFKLIGFFAQDDLLKAVSESETVLSDSSVNLLKSILLFISQHYSEKLRLSELAAEFGFSAKYFSRFFKKNLDRTFVEYLNSFRIERAADLLLNTDQPVSRIASGVGFDNFSYFISTFRKMHSCTPSHYRKLRHSLEMHQYESISP